MSPHSSWQSEHKHQVNPQAESRVDGQRQVEVRNDPAVFRDRPVPEKKHKSILDSAFIFVLGAHASLSSEEAPCA